MDTATVSAIAGAVALIVGAIVGYFAVRVLANDVIHRAERDSERTLADARTARREVELEGQEEALKYRQQIEDELRDQRREVSRSERRIEQRDEGIERRAETLERSEQSVRDRQERIDRLDGELETERTQLHGELERIAGMSVDDARSSLLEQIDDELREEQGRRVRAMETSAQAEADTRSRKMLATVMQRMTSEITAETTVSIVPIPSDDIKGRIIGREGRNIRAFEAATGCDLIIDDTPEVVTVSGFDPVRREVARVALSRLIQDGRIQPTRIEEAVDRARIEVEESVVEAGEDAMVDAEVSGLHPEVVKTLGRLRYRFSYGQNQLRHSLETSWLAGALAEELGADVEVARVGGLLHDLGKAVDREVAGTHAKIGAEIAGRFQVSREVVHCIEAHHEEVRPETTEALIVIIADAMSGSRPGARRESSEQYIKRLEALESIANSFAGVESSFAIQAGREVRIIVQPEQIDDTDAMRLARDVSRKIEETMQYPGEIKVTVVRETRASAVAH
ncbi:MAG: ribonuclease Y [Dehalococcoidia bacterium]